MAEERVRPAMPKIIGTIISIKGHCGAGHKVGDKIELSLHNTGGLCGLFYHDIFPFILLLQYGADYPRDRPGRAKLECADRRNAVTIELQREK